MVAMEIDPPAEAETVARQPEEGMRRTQSELLDDPARQRRMRMRVELMALRLRMLSLHRKQAI